MGNLRRLLGLGTPLLDSQRLIIIVLTCCFKNQPISAIPTINRTSAKEVFVSHAHLQSCQITTRIEISWRFSTVGPWVILKLTTMWITNRMTFQLALDRKHHRRFISVSIITVYISIPRYAPWRRERERGRKEGCRCHAGHQRYQFLRLVIWIGWLVIFNLILLLTWANFFFYNNKK